jgi:GNAT superfamily N-acetyltransferase
MLIVTRIATSYPSQMGENIEHELALCHVLDDLPIEFHRLLDASLEEGVWNMQLRLQHWKSGAERFDQQGEALFAALQGGTLIGMAGTTREKDDLGPAMRMRRLYVLPEWRRRGVARTLARQCMDTGLQTAPTLTCNAQASAAAGPFWISMGFVPTDLPHVTHIYVSS